jgi:hypothetical protein
MHTITSLLMQAGVRLRFLSTTVRIFKFSNPYGFFLTSDFPEERLRNGWT